MGKTALASKAAGQCREKRLLLSSSAYERPTRVGHRLKELRRRGKAARARSREEGGKRKKISRPNSLYHLSHGQREQDGLDSLSLLG
jgi:hypothetical protein